MLRPVGITWVRDDDSSESVVSARLRDTDRLDDQDLLELALASATVFGDSAALSAGARRPRISGLGKLLLEFASSSEEDMHEELDRSMKVKSAPEGLVNECLRLLGSGNYGVVVERCAPKRASKGAGVARCDTGACVAIKFQVETSTTALETQHASDLAHHRATAEFVPRIYSSRTFYAPKYRKTYHATAMEVLRSPFPTVAHLLTNAPLDTIKTLLPHIVDRIFAGLVAVRSAFPLLRHNDLGPYNVFLDGPDARRVLLGDWGLSFDLEADRRSRPSTLSRPWVLWTVEDNRKNYVLVNLDTHERRVVQEGDSELDDEILVSYVAPILCEYYDIFYCMFRVRRALMKRFGLVDGAIPTVERVFDIMFRNSYVMMHPDYEDLVEKGRFPGRLTTLMQVEIQSAIVRGELPSLTKAYEISRM